MPFFDTSKPPRLISGRSTNHPPTSPFSNTSTKGSNEYATRPVHSQWLDLSSEGSTSANSNSSRGGNGSWNSETVGHVQQRSGMNESESPSSVRREDNEVVGVEDVEIEKSNILLL